MYPKSQVLEAEKATYNSSTKKPSVSKNKSGLLLIILEVCD
jgi:hypothetical protein